MDASHATADVARWWQDKWSREKIKVAFSIKPTGRAADEVRGEG
jgi:hypothetical protein